MTVNYGGTWKVKLEPPSTVPMSDRTGWWYKVIILDARGIIVWESVLQRLAEAQVLRHDLLSHLRDGFQVRLDLYYCRFGASPIMRRIRALYTTRVKRRKYLKTVYLVQFEVHVPALIQAPSMRRARRFVRRAIKALRLKHSVVRAKTARPSPEIKTGTWSTETERWLGGVYSYSSSPTTLELYRRTWTGVRTPGFGALHKGSLPVNPHSVTIAYTFPGGNSTEARFKPLTGYPYADVYRYHSSMTNHYAFTATLGFDSSVYNRAISKIIARAGVSMEANLAQDLAQIGQLTGLVKTTCLRLVKSVTALRKRNLKGAAQALWGPKEPKYGQDGLSLKKTTAENWLELQYGWKPLLQDIQGTMDTISSLMTSRRKVWLVTASAKMDRAYSQPLMLWAYPTIRAGSSRTTDQQTVKIGLRYMVDDELTSFLAQTGFTNPLNLAWEILPFSFVADWFLPIGPYLEALSAWNGLTFVDGFSVSFQKLTQTLAVGYGGLPAGGGASLVNYSDSGSALKVQIAMVRGRLTSFPNMRYPRPKNGVSLLHSLNALALLQTNLRDPRKR